MYRSAIKTIFFVFAILISFSSCNVSSSDEGPKLTPEDAINSLAELSPTAGAQFYVDNRNDFPFLDTLYVDNIVPIIGLCGFDTIKVVKERVENTPADDALEIYYKNTREDYLASINQEIKENAISQKKGRTGNFPWIAPAPLTKYLSTTEHEERQVTDSMHLCSQPLYL